MAKTENMVCHGNIILANQLYLKLNEDKKFKHQINIMC